MSGGGGHIIIRSTTGERPLTNNETAFLDMLAWSEIGPELLAMPETDNGYKVLVGSTPSKPLLFDDYSDHPNVFNVAINSTAAGRYQLLHRFWSYYKHLLMLTDFGPSSQNSVAIQQIKESQALADVNAGNVESAVFKCSHIWASLPGNTYKQHQNKIDDLKDVYIKAGGTV